MKRIIYFLSILLPLMAEAAPGTGGVAFPQRGNGLAPILTASGSTQLASDNFERGDETPLASPWAHVVTADGFNFNLATHVVVPALTSNDKAWIYTGPTYTADQAIQVAVTVTGTSAGSGLGVVGRAATDGTSKTYYRIVVSHAVSGNVDCKKYITGTPTSIGSATVTWVDGDVLRTEITGSATTTIKIYQNGALISTLTDSSSPITAAGSCGLGYSSTVTSGSVDNFFAYSIP